MDIKGDTRSLDHSSYTPRNSACLAKRRQLLLVEPDLVWVSGLEVFVMLDLGQSPL